MNNEQFISNEFIIKLTIEGTEYEEVEVNVTDTTKTIRDQIATIISVFNLPKMDNGGSPIQYFLGMTSDSADAGSRDEYELLSFEDENGREQSLFDYDIQPGDHLYVVKSVIAG